MLSKILFIETTTYTTQTATTESKTYSTSYGTTDYFYQSGGSGVVEYRDYINSHHIVWEINHVCSHGVQIISNYFDTEEGYDILMIGEHRFSGDDVEIELHLTDNPLLMTFISD